MRYIILAAAFLLLGAVWQKNTADPLEQAYGEYNHVQLFEDGSYSGDQLTVVRQWLEYMEKCVNKENLSYGEIVEIQSVYDLLKDNEY